MFISITFTETSIDETNKTQQKVRGSKFMLKMSTIYANTCIQTTTPLCNCCCNDDVLQQPPLPQQTFFQLLHIMHLVDPLLKDTPDAVVHRIQIWQIGWPHLWRDKIWCLSLQHGDSVMCMGNGMISVTSSLRPAHSLSTSLSILYPRCLYGHGVYLVGQIQHICSFSRSCAI